MYQERLVNIMDELDDIQSQVSSYCTDPSVLQQTQLTRETADEFIDIASQCGCQLEKLLYLLDGEKQCQQQ